MRQKIEREEEGEKREIKWKRKKEGRKNDNGKKLTFLHSNCKQHFSRIFKYCINPSLSSSFLLLFSSFPFPLCFLPSFPSSPFLLHKKREQNIFFLSFKVKLNHIFYDSRNTPNLLCKHTYTHTPIKRTGEREKENGRERERSEKLPRFPIQRKFEQAFIFKHNTNILLFVFLLLSSPFFLSLRFYFSFSLLFSTFFWLV